MIEFNKLQVNQNFIYDNEIFVKSIHGCKRHPNKGGTAWSLRDGKPYKEWAFDGTEQVEPTTEVK